MWWLVSVAAAHVPHDNVEGMTVPPRGEGTWYLLLNPTGNRAWLQSDDTGDSWRFVGGPHLADEVFPPYLLADGTVVVVGIGRYWWSTDGVEWENAGLPAFAEVVVPGETLRLAGEDGIWEGSPGGTMTQVVTEAITLVGSGAVLRADGEILVDGAGGWSSIGAADGEVTALYGDQGVVWVGTADGRILRWQADTWLTCGDTVDRGADANDVTRFAMDGSTLLVATGTRAPWVSTDGCASFEDRSTGVLTDYGPGTGGAESEALAFTHLSVVAPGRWVVAGWAGLFTTSDAGETWVDPPLVPPDDTRGFTFAADFPSDPRAFVGAYSASVLQTADGGLTWRSPNHGVASTNVSAVYTSDNDPDRLWGILNHMAWLSEDGGESWTPHDQTGLSEAVLLEPTAGQWRLVGDSVYRTVDDGATYAEDTELVSMLGGGGLIGIHFGDDYAFATGTRPSSLLRQDADGAWTMLWRDEAGLDMTRPILWPSDAPTHVVFGGNIGVHRFGTDGTFSSVTPVADHEAIVKMAILGDDRLLAFTRSSLVHISEDGGVSWTSTEIRLPWPVATVQARPDWEAHPEVMVGSYDGVWRLDFSSDVPVATPWTGVQRLDNSSNFLVCAGCPDQIADADADLDTVQPLGLGRMSGWVYGDEVVVYGESTGGGAELIIDGITVGTVGTVAATGEIGRFEGLGEGWHRLDLVGLPGNDVSIDVIESWRETTPLDLSVPPGSSVGAWPGDPKDDTAGDTGSAGSARCGCAAAETRVGAAGLAPLLAFWARRRRRAGRPVPQA